MAHDERPCLLCLFFYRPCGFSGFGCSLGGISGIIPCLDVRDGRVVKGTNFEGIKDVADPVEMARLYNAAGAEATPAT